MALDCSGAPGAISLSSTTLDGTAFAETDLDRANDETTIADDERPALRPAAGDHVQP